MPDNDITAVLQNALNSLSDVTELPEGGQKRVFKGLHPDLGPVVIKWGEFPNPKGLERITREVELLKNLESPYFPRNHDFLINIKTNEFLITEEYIDGESLATSMDRFSGEVDVARFLWHICEGLAPIWNRDIVHRDLKPGNILVTDDHLPRIVDFGIARFLREESLTESLAMVGPGTPIYAAPEQLRNQKHLIDPRTDQFVMGIDCFQIAYGYHPFDPSKVGQGQSIPENILNGLRVTEPENQDYTEAYGDLVNRLLGQFPYQRYAAGKVLQESLETRFEL